MFDLLAVIRYVLMIESVKELLDIPKEADEVHDTDVAHAGPGDTHAAVLVTRTGVVTHGML